MSRCTQLFPIAWFAFIAGCSGSSTTPAEADHCPPFFVSTEALPTVSRVAVLDAVGTTADFSVSVPLESCAKASSYNARVFVDGHLYSENSVESSGKERRPASFTVALPPGCHRVEVLATTAFAPSADLRTPQKADDLAEAVWFVAVRSPSVAPTIDDCNR